LEKNQVPLQKSKQKGKVRTDQAKISTPPRGEGKRIKKTDVRKKRGSRLRWKKEGGKFGRIGTGTERLGNIWPQAHTTRWVYTYEIGEVFGTGHAC